MVKEYFGEEVLPHVAHVRCHKLSNFIEVFLTPLNLEFLVIYPNAHERYGFPS